MCGKACINPFRSLKRPLKNAPLFCVVCCFLYPVQQVGGAIYIYGSLSVTGSLFEGNDAYQETFGDGGAISIWGGSTAHITNGTFMGNTAGVVSIPPMHFLRLDYTRTWVLAYTILKHGFIYRMVAPFTIMILKCS